MALELFELLEDVNINGNPHYAADRIHMTQEQVDRFLLGGKVRVVKPFEASEPVEITDPNQPVPETTNAE